MQPTESHSVSSRVARGAFWIFSFKLLERSIGFVSTLVLARLLMPKDFGIVAMATSLMAILEMFTAFNFEVALIQKPRPTMDDYSAAWTLNCALGLGTAIAMLLLAYPLAAFFREPVLVEVVAILAVVPVIQSAYNIGLTEYRKNLQFQPDFVFQAVKKIAGFIVIVPLALWMRSYWALIIGMISSQVAGTLISYRLHPMRPRLRLAGSRSLLTFSVWTLIGNALTTARVRASHFVLGRVAGPGALGVFAMGSDITTLPTTELVMPINRAIFPAYASLASDSSALRRAYLAVLGLVALTITPAAVGLISVSHLAIPLLLGDRWGGVVSLVAPLALFGLSMSLQTNSSSMYWAVGRPRLGAFTSGLMLLALLFPIVPLTRDYGALGTAMACLISGVITLPVTFWLMAHLLDLRASDFVAGLWRPALASLAMYGVLQALSTGQMASVLPNDDWVGLLIAIALGATTYVACVAALWAASGRPEGAETFVAGRTMAVIRSRAQVVHK